MVKNLTKTGLEKSETIKEKDFYNQQNSSLNQKLLKKQQKLDRILSYILTRGKANEKELMRLYGGMPRESVHAYCRELEKKGHIKQIVKPKIIIYKPIN